MSMFARKIDFVLFIYVCMANPNGDPQTENRPRINMDGFGEISAECIRRKIRNRMQDLGYPIFVQSEDRCDDGFSSLAARANAKMKGFVDRDVYAREACKTWLDVRSFGQVFAFKGKGKGKDEKGVSIPVRGPVTVRQAVSVSPVEIESMQITKSVNGEDVAGGGRSSDTMGMRHFVRSGLYKVSGAITVQLAEKTGFTEEDAAVIKECLRTLFVNDASTARPEGSMEVVKLYWFEHSCKLGDYASAKVHRSVEAHLKDGVETPASLEDFVITHTPLEGLEPEILDGV